VSLGRGSNVNNGRLTRSGPCLYSNAITPNCHDDEEWKDRRTVLVGLVVVRRMEGMGWGATTIPLE